MTEFLAGLVIFFGVHSISIINDSWRNRAAAHYGEWAWKGGYGLIAFIGLLLIVHGYSIARMDPVVLYTPPDWLRLIAVVLLIPVFPLLFAAYLPGRIRNATRHPMLVATKLWATAHLLVNGTLVDVLLFGGFLLWAVVDRISLKQRTPRPVPSAPPTAVNDVTAIVLGLAVYLAFGLWLHLRLIGVPAFPA